MSAIRSIVRMRKFMSAVVAKYNFLFFWAALFAIGASSVPLHELKQGGVDENIVLALRLVSIGLIAGVFGLFRAAFGGAGNLIDRSEIWLLVRFCVMAILGVNGGLTLAFLHLEPGMAFAIFTSVAFSAAFLLGTRTVWSLIGCVLAAVGAILMLSVEFQAQLNAPGVMFAATAGFCQAYVLTRDVFPSKSEPAIAISVAFLLGGVISAIVVGAESQAAEQEMLEIVDSSVVLIVGLTSLATVAGWLVFAYQSRRMTDTQKNIGTAFEPTGASLAQWTLLSSPTVAGMIGAFFVVASAATTVFTGKRQESGQTE